VGFKNLGNLPLFPPISKCEPEILGIIVMGGFLEDVKLAILAKLQLN
jgi:hypothetical protein